MSALLRKPGFKFGSLFAAMFLLAAGLFVYAADPGGGQNNVTLSLTRAPDGDKLDHGTKVDVTANVDCSGADIRLKITYLPFDEELQGPELDDEDGNAHVIYESDPGTTGQDSYQIDTGARKPGSYWIVATSSKANNSPQTDSFDIGQYLPGEAPTSKIFFVGGDVYTVGGNYYIAHSGKENVRCKKPVDKDADYLGSVVDDSFNVDGAIQWAGPQHHPAGEYSAPNKRRTQWTAPSEGKLTYVVLYLDDDGRYYDDFPVPTQVQSVEVHLFTLDSVSLDKNGTVPYREDATLTATASYRGDIPGGKLRYVLVKNGEDQDGVEDGGEHTFQIAEPGKYSVKIFFDKPTADAQQVTSTEVVFYKIDVSPNPMIFDYNPGGDASSIIRNSEGVSSKIGEFQRTATIMKDSISTAEASAQVVGQITNGWPTRLQRLVALEVPLGNSAAAMWARRLNVPVANFIFDYTTSLYHISQMKEKQAEADAKREELEDLVDELEPLLRKLRAEDRSVAPQTLVVKYLPTDLTVRLSLKQTEWTTRDAKYSTTILCGLERTSESPGEIQYAITPQGNLGKEYRWVNIEYGELSAQPAVWEASVSGLTQEEALAVAEAQIKLWEQEIEDGKQAIDDASAMAWAIVGSVGIVIAIISGTWIFALIVGGILTAVLLLVRFMEWLLRDDPRDVFIGKIKSQYPKAN